MDPPRRSSDVTGVPGAQLRRVAETMAKNKPATLIWCMGGTQHTVGTANVRAFSILQLALGNIGVAGGGTNIFRGHDNVQGATDFGLDVTSAARLLRAGPRAPGSTGPASGTCPTTG